MLFLRYWILTVFLAGFALSTISSPLKGLIKVVIVLFPACFLSLSDIDPISQNAGALECNNSSRPDR